MTHELEQSTIKRIKTTLRVLKAPCALAAFSIASLIRLIPELESPRYPVGYDTAFYAYEILQAPRSSVPALLAFADLYKIIAGCLVKLSGVDAYLLLKLLCPATYGLLALSYYVFLRSATRWNPKTCLLCTALFSFQIPSLRLSWDLLKNELGMSFLLMFLAVVRKKGLKGKWMLAGLLALLVVFSHQLPAVLMFIWALYNITVWRKSPKNDVRKLILSLTPAAIFFTYQLLIFLGVLRLPPPPEPHSPTRTVIRLRPSSLERPPSRLLKNYFLSPNLLQSSYIDLVVIFTKLMAICYLPLAPLALMGLKRHEDLEPLALWPLVASVSVLILPYTYPFYSFFRWLLLLTFPASAYATYGLLKLAKRGRPWRVGLALLITLYMVMGSGYASGTVWQLHDEDVNAYLPWSLLESTIGVGQIDDCVECLRWLSEHAGNGSVLIAEQRFYAWALSFLDTRIALAFYPHGYPINDVPVDELVGHFEEVYLIWYVDSSLRGFKEVFSHGDIAIYEYTTSVINPGRCVNAFWPTAS